MGAIGGIEDTTGGGACCDSGHDEWNSGSERWWLSDGKQIVRLAPFRLSANDANDACSRRGHGHGPWAN